MKVICLADRTPGWAPVYYMAHLFAELTSTKLHIVSDRPTVLNALECTIGSRYRNASKPDLLIISTHPRKLRLIATMKGWRRDYNRCFAWITDSFWTSRIPILNFTGIFDHLFVMSGNDVDEYRTRTRVETSFLGWGTDALRNRDIHGDRKIDLIRVGRQNAEWDNDEDNLKFLKDRRITYQGRPPVIPDPVESHKQLLGFLRQSKFALAFSNLVSPAPYTHPKKEYVTARWTDAVGSGCIVAGIPPKSDYAFEAYFTQDTVLEFPSINRLDSIDLLSQAIREWTPDRVAISRSLALRQLDWRWRFKQVAKIAGTEWPLLNAEFAELQEAIKNIEIPGQAK